MSQIRIANSLNSGEQKHIEKRKPFIEECMKRNHVAYKKVPNIALLGSGGGERAMVGLLGSLYQMEKVDLLDCSLYLCGVSGSTWCMSSLYKESNWSNKIEEEKNRISNRLGHDHVSILARGEEMVKYYRFHDLFNLTDVWAALVVPEIVKEIDENTLSSHREGHCEDPYPIYTIIDQDSKYAKLDEKDRWFELTPHEAGYSITGAFVDTTRFGSQFDKGELTKSQPERDMSYIQGVCGSAIADREIILEELKKLIEGERSRLKKTDSRGPLVLQKIVELHLCIYREEDYTKLCTELNSLLKETTAETEFWRTEHSKQELFDHTRLVCESIFKWFPDVIDEIWRAIVKAILKVVEHFLEKCWIWGTQYNFLHNIPHETAPDVAPQILTENIRHFEDAGLLLNSPYFCVLRPERQIDLIISLDFSAGNPMETVLQAHKICKKMNIQFPPVVVTPEDAETPNDFYVFKGVNTPTVIHMPLFNTGNCKEDLSKMRKKYTTFQGAYSPEMITELMELAGKNITNNKERLLKEIEKVSK